MDNRFETFTALILQINRSIQHIKLLEMEEFSLKGIHAICLFYLHQNPDGLSQAELVRDCLEDKARVSRALHELSDRGLIRIPEGPHSKKYNAKITLTQEGEAIAGSVQQKVNTAMDACSQGLDNHSRALLYQSLALIQTNMDLYIRSLSENSPNADR